jgi:pimeloyl-ACP methyl ester carboxylesterase
MTTPEFKSGFVSIDGAQIYYETAGGGTPFVMIHAGVADHRQWNNEFAAFARDYHVLRYDLRGHGKSEPVEGRFSHMGDLAALLDALHLHESMIMMGCSMGGSLVMDFALAHPSRVKALIMAGSAPSGLDLDVPMPAKFADAEMAYESGDLDLLAEMETRLWFDGTDRTPDQVNPDMRKLAYEMNRLALSLEARKLGKRLPDAKVPAFDRLSEIGVPVMIIIGDRDTPYILAAADYMVERLSSARKVTIDDAAHLANMDHPQQFQTVVRGFLEGLS